MDDNDVKKLRAQRPLLLAMEAVGWLHMLGKARADFLRGHGGQNDSYDYKKWHEQESPPFPWDDLLGWVKDQLGTVEGAKDNKWPSTLTDFLTKHAGNNAGILGLLQAGHGMASGIEKNIPSAVSKYLGQDVTHMWLSSAFGQPVRNLLVDPPEVLTQSGWQRLLGEVQRMLKELRSLATAKAEDVGAWQRWRESAIGQGSSLRTALASTIAETRLPNNDVTLWDQSYVASALFKSAVAGAVLEGSGFPWCSSNLKQTTRWRLLTVGIGTDHYEARAVRIGDWIGAHAAIEAFLNAVCQLIEVDLAVGSLLYRDASLCVFSFPGERPDGKSANLKIDEKVEEFAKGIKLETPPLCRLSEPTRSLVPLVKEMRAARDTLAVPVHKAWSISTDKEQDDKRTPGHVCPVCLVRYNGKASDKQHPCKVCKKRRRGRLDAWLNGRLGSDTIWISEVADANDRLALLTLSLDLEPWLEGKRLDSLRSQAISEWRAFNPTVQSQPNPMDASQPFASLTAYIKGKLGSYDKRDPVLQGLQEGYRYENNWQSFFEKIVEDRADAPQWSTLNDGQRARWLVHQLFCKLPSPGRVYRFWRQAEEFFNDVLLAFREIAARDPNSWRVRRLVLLPDASSPSAGWQDREVYEGRWGEAPLGLLYRRDQGAFVTTCNLARLLRAEENAAVLQGKELRLQGDDNIPRLLRVKQIKDAGALGAYQPVIPLEVSPLRFRVVVPLEAASACLDQAIAAWNTQLAQVWDRLPLRASVVAFPRKLPFQAVIEMARQTEQRIESAQEQRWRVMACEVRAGAVALTVQRLDGGVELRTIPIELPDGRTDAFYPYLAVEDGTVRFPYDFQHPCGQVYRHARDLRPGDSICVSPAQVAALFLDTAGRRFEPVKTYPLSEWGHMREVWRTIERASPSMTALHGAWSELVALEQSWKGTDGDWLPGGEHAWGELARAILADRLAVRGAALDALVAAGVAGTLDWALHWHLAVVKEQLRR